MALLELDRSLFLVSLAFLAACGNTFVRPDNIAAFDFHLADIDIEGQAFPNGVAVFEGYRLRLDQSARAYSVTCSSNGTEYAPIASQRPILIAEAFRIWEYSGSGYDNSFTSEGVSYSIRLTMRNGDRRAFMI